MATVNGTEALKVKYEQNRAEVLKHLDVSHDLLDVLTRHGLIDIADCVKYQGIYDVKKRNGSLMKTMVERRTDRAYPLFIHSLRQAGQHSVADLLTDIGEETRILTHLQSELEHEIEAIADYIQQEERRAGVSSTATGGGGGENGGQTTEACKHHPPPPVPTSDREVWVGVQSTLKRARMQFDRCRAVIDKLHQDCQDLATANGDMVTQIRNCYSRVKRLLKPGHDSGRAEVPKSTQAMFQSVIDDVEKLMNRKSKAQQQENEGRTTAMRMLRHLRDWVQERSSILDTLHASTVSPSPSYTTAPPLSFPTRYDTERYPGGDTPTTTPPFHPRYTSSRQQTPSPSRSQITSEEGSGGGSQHLMTYFRGTSNQGQDEGQDHGKGQDLGHAGSGDEQVDEDVEVMRAEHVRHVEPHAISTVLEGLQLLEQQVRQYVQMEILLTDKFRAQMRYRHLRKKSHGYSPKGLEEANRTLDRLEPEASHLTSNSLSPNNTINGSRHALGGGRGGGGGGGGDSKLYLSKLRASFDAMCDEYSDCVNYMIRISNSSSRVIPA